MPFFEHVFFPLMQFLLISPAFAPFPALGPGTNRIMHLVFDLAILPKDLFVGFPESFHLREVLGWCADFRKTEELDGFLFR